MAIQDNWHANLVALVEREGKGDKRSGYKAVAERTGLAEEYVYQLTLRKPRANGAPREVGKEAARKIARAFAEGRDEGWFDQPGAITLAAHQHADNVVIKQYETGGAMGNGLVLRDQPGVIRGWNVTREWVEKNVPYYTTLDNLSIVTGFGDSMLGMFNPGDPLLVDRGITKADVDGVYFFRVGEEGFIKRLQRIPGEGVVVISENPKYRDWTIKPDMDFQVMAKVLRAWNGQNL